MPSAGSPSSLGLCGGICGDKLLAASKCAPAPLEDTLKMPTTTNNGARVHPAQPCYFVVVPAPELSSINVAVRSEIGRPKPLRKGPRTPTRQLPRFGRADGRLSVGDFSHHRPPHRRWCRSHLRRLLDPRRLRLPAVLADRPIGEGNRQHGSRDDRSQKTRNGLRRHSRYSSSPCRPRQPDR